MDATPLSKKAPPAAADDDALTSAAQQAVEPQPGDAAAGVKTSGGGEDDDEQVERFYALLDNIRAMRGMVGTATAAERKRAREAEPPWRPAFRMEDFEVEEVRSDDAAAPCCDASKRAKRGSTSRGARRPPASRKDSTDGEVVEAKGPSPAQCEQACRAGVLAVDS